MLTPLGHDVHTVTGEGLIGRADQEIWTHCQLEDRLLITQDLDFSDSRKFQPGSHAGIILVRLQNPGRIALLDLLSSVFRNHAAKARRTSGAMREASPQTKTTASCWSRRHTSSLWFLIACCT